MAEAKALATLRNVSVNAPRVGGGWFPGNGRDGLSADPTTFHLPRIGPDVLLRPSESS